MCIHKRERSELYKSKTDKTEKKKKDKSKIIIGDLNQPFNS